MRVQTQYYADFSHPGRLVALIAGAWLIVGLAVLGLVQIWTWIS